MNKDALFYWLIDAQAISSTFGVDRMSWATCHRIAEKLADSGALEKIDVVVGTDEYIVDYADAMSHNDAVKIMDEWRTK